MKRSSLVTLTLVPVLLSLTACDVQQTEKGSLPDVDVDVKGGNLPKYDVDTADIDIEKKQVTVPTLDYDSPAEQRAEEKTGVNR